MNLQKSALWVVWVASCMAAVGCDKSGGPTGEQKKAAPAPPAVPAHTTESK
jgi:hypothetical protein